MLRPDLLRLEAVGRRFPNGTEALRDVTLDVPAGGITALLGPSGCGKSTLLRIVAGLDQPSSGQVRWSAGTPPDAIGYVFQDATLMPWATAEDNVRLPLRLRHQPAGETRQAARAALARVGLAGQERARPHQLSGGMRMRVSLARALVGQPRLLLMDEPFAALDEYTRHGLQDMLLGLVADRRCSVLFVTHSVYEAAFLADRVVLMRPCPGRIGAVLPVDVPVDVRPGADRRNGAAYHAAVAQLGAAAAALRGAA